MIFGRGLTPAIERIAVLRTNNHCGCLLLEPEPLLQPQIRVRPQHPAPITELEIAKREKTMASGAWRVHACPLWVGEEAATASANAGDL
jgi:hypothetical protein